VSQSNLSYFSFGSHLYGQSKPNLLLRLEKEESCQIQETFCRLYEGGGGGDAGLPASQHENAFRRGVAHKLTGETTTLTVRVSVRG
jgi:hypothetical protein